jgi:uncharacterized protein
LISVLLEELLQRSPDLGTPAMILIDVHGEYRFLKQKIPSSEDHCMDEIQRKIQNYNASFLQVGVSDLSAYDFQRYQPGISIPQLRELRKVIKICRKKFIYSRKNDKLVADTALPMGYEIPDLIEELQLNPDINTKTRETLIGWLEDLNHLGIFGRYKSPSLNDFVRVGELSVIDFSSMISMRKKQILLHYFTNSIFKARRNNIISPFILFLEEAHNFLPETGGKSAIAKGILETLAREGRKFFAQLVMVSQRPVHLSTTALSQCNTQIIMRVTNPYDLNHIKSTSESITSESMGIISSLPTGNALIIGAASNYPVFVKIRNRSFPNIAGETSLSEVAKRYVKKSHQILLEATKLEQYHEEYFHSYLYDQKSFEIKE